MRNYKGLVIPDREPRTELSIWEGRASECYKRRFSCVGVRCVDCLFDTDNIAVFTEWYMAKNKKRKA